MDNWVVNGAVRNSEDEICGIGLNYCSKFTIANRCQNHQRCWNCNTWIVLKFLNWRGTVCFFFHIKILGSWWFNYNLGAGRANYIKIVSLVYWLEKHSALKNSFKIESVAVFHRDPLRSWNPTVIICDLQTVWFPCNIKVINFSRRSDSILIIYFDQF